MTNELNMIICIINNRRKYIQYARSRTYTDKHIWIWWEIFLDTIFIYIFCCCYFFFSYAGIPCIYSLDADCKWKPYGFSEERCWINDDGNDEAVVGNDEQR